MASVKKVSCPHCGKRLADRNGVYTHIKAKHGGKGKAAYRDAPEPSFADRAIDAELDRMMGVDNSDSEWLLP